MSEHTDHKGSYLKVFGVLTVGTILTMAAAQLMHDTPHELNIAVALLIATVKATCVMAIFMHLKYDVKVLRVAVFFPLALFFVFILGNAPDTAVGMEAATLDAVYKPKALAEPFDPTPDKDAHAAPKPADGTGENGTTTPPDDDSADDD